MKKIFMYQILVVVAGMILAGAVSAVEMDHSAHDMDGGSTMDKPFHQSVVDGYSLRYKLIDMREQMKKMKGTDHVTATHHLMLFIKKKHGSHEMPVTKAKVGYLLETPDGKKATAMTMPMGGGFGADIDLSKQGDYVIKTKIIDGGTKFVDAFHHKVD